MKSPIYKMNKILTNSMKLSFAVFTLTYTTASIAETPDQNTADQYVDSITQWGAWELDIEPAAGGLRQPATQALKARDSKITVRTNSFSALAPTPPTPPRRPVTPPFGGPSDGFF